ncbi:hypothetical protein DCC85_18665 [Paenibacillus sp. CAA11]|uniref:hypothetical protein n=1 Tax=Paenibacillus sp. CAA11 TaxID=1532905 RepID=UPI000D3B5493|nr:hypothetical protein [Paenibacillus sp. CAA11]AWB45992.1 hypothetical protein DCC85_18665 [Paenibacillus sp. CAA11]
MKWLRVLAVLLLVLLLLAGGLIWYLRPDKSLNLNYTDIAWKSKLETMIKQRQAVMTLSEEEVNNLAKKEIALHKSDTRLPVDIKGADFKISGNELTADVIAGWGPIVTEGVALYEMDYKAGMLELRPLSVNIKGLDLSPDTLGLETIQVDPSKYLPNIVKVSSMEFPGSGLKLHFSLDLFDLGSLIW